MNRSTPLAYVETLLPLVGGMSAMAATLAVAVTAAGLLYDWLRAHRQP